MNFKIFFLIPVVLFISLNSQGAERNSVAYEFNKTGMYYLNKGDPESASRYFIKAVAAEPSNKYYSNNMAASLMRRGDYSGAEKFLIHAIELDAEYTRALSNMSITLFYLGRYSEAYKYYVRSLQTDSRYTKKRFEKRKVRATIRRISNKDPDNENLKRILEYLDKD